MLIRSCAYCVAFVTLATALSATAAVPPNDTLYPVSTHAFFSVPNVPAIGDRWKTTRIHELFQNEEMKPFAEDLHRQLNEKWLANHERIGISIEDLRAVASGELSGAIFKTEAGRTALALLVDVTGNEPKAKDALAKADANLLKEKAKKSSKTVAGVVMTIYDLPPKEDRHDARRIAYFLHNGLLAGADGPDALADIIARLGGKGKDNLLSLGPYKEVSKRLKTAAGELVPDMRWYLDPLATAEYRAQGNEKRLKNIKMLRNQGFSAIQGVGGYLNLAVDDYEVLHRTAVYAPKPFEKAMGMLDFPNSAPHKTPDWVPQEVVTCTTLNWEIKTAFERFSTLFDELFGEGSAGTFNDTIDSVREDPNGPGIDIRKDLVGHLGTRAVVLTDYDLPITPSSERFVFAAETTDEAALASAVQKSLGTDPNVIKREFQNFVIWEMQAEEDSLTSVVVEHPDEPAGGSAVLGSGTGKPDEKQGPGGRLRSKLGEDEEEAVKLPNAAVAVARGHLFIASHVDFLEKILGSGEDADARLENNADYKRVNAELQKLGADEFCIRNFSRADEQLRITYDLFKAGKLPESETMLAQILRSAEEEQPEGSVRKAKLDGSKLPDYQVMRDHLGIGGAYLKTEEQGWIVVGFLYKKPAK